MCCVGRLMQKTQFGGLITTAVLAASIIAALNFTTMYTLAQNATSGNNSTVRNTTNGSTTSSSSCGTGSTASSCYDEGYQNALANPGKTCPTGQSNNYCLGWALVSEKR